MINDEIKGVLVQDIHNQKDYHLKDFNEALDIIQSNTGSHLTLKALKAKNQQYVYFLYDSKATPDINVTPILESMLNVFGIEKSNEQTNSIFLAMFGDSYKKNSSLIQSPMCLSKDELTAELCLIFHGNFTLKYF